MQYVITHLPNAHVKTGESFKTHYVFMNNFYLISNSNQGVHCESYI